MKPNVDGCAVIDDGYTRAGYIAGVPYSTPAVRFRYRPPLITPLSIIRDEIRKSKPESQVAIQAKTICKYVESWDVKDAQGEIVKLDIESIKRVDPFIFSAVAGVVLGFQFTEVDPEWARSEAETESSRAIDSIFGGDPSQAEVNDVKN